LKRPAAVRGRGQPAVKADFAKKQAKKLKKTPKGIDKGGKMCYNNMPLENGSF